MATWQFDMLAVPRAEAVQHFGEVPAMIPIGEITSRLMRSAPYPVGIERRFSGLLPANPPRFPGTKYWGDDDGHSVTLIFDGKELCEVYIRIDMRDFSLWVIEGLTAIACAYDWLFITITGQVITPGSAGLVHCAVTSPAARFVASPRAFLEEIDRHGLDAVEDDPSGS